MENVKQQTPTSDFRPLRIAVSGAGGLIGKPLCRLLSNAGHHVLHIVRTSSDTDDKLAPWSDSFDTGQWSTVDAVIHLAGKPIANSRWTSQTKTEIRASRVDKTAQLCKGLAEHSRDKPLTLLSASAIGLYGANRGDLELNEQATAGDDFLADVGVQWEMACKPARDAGVRVVNLRIGVVLSTEGGALKKMLPPARWGLGGPAGTGQQWWSWIAIDDLVAAIYHVLSVPTISGPVNLVSPNPVRQSNFSKTLGKVLKRPAFLPVPAFVLRKMLGEMADALILSSTRVRPDVLTEAGFSFRYPELEPALRHLLNH